MRHAVLAAVRRVVIMAPISSCARNACSLPHTAERLTMRLFVSLARPLTAGSACHRLLYCSVVSRTQIAMLPGRQSDGTIGHACCRFIPCVQLPHSSSDSVTTFDTPPAIRSLRLSCLLPAVKCMHSMHRMHGGATPHNRM